MDPDQAERRRLLEEYKLKKNAQKTAGKISSTSTLKSTRSSIPRPIPVTRLPPKLDADSLRSKAPLSMKPPSTARPLPTTVKKPGLTKKLGSTSNTHTKIDIKKNLENIPHGRGSLKAVSVKYPNLSKIAIKANIETTKRITSFPLNFFTRNTLKIIVYEDSKIIESNTHGISQIDLFTLDDALLTAQKGEREVSRAIFSILIHSEYPFNKQRIAFNGGKRVIISTDYRKNLNVWLAWARYEEQWRNFETVVTIFEDAEACFTSPQDAEKLAAQFKLFLLRLNESVGNHELLDSFVDIEVEMNDTLPKNSTFSRYRSPSPPIKIRDSDDEDVEYLNKAYGFQKEVAVISSDSDSDSEANIATPRPALKKTFRNVTPFMRKISDQNLVDNFELMDLEATPRMKPRKKVLGVAMHTPGSSITVLTPVAASKKEKVEYGVDVVVTPVRRSLRFMDDVEYISSINEKENAPQHEKVKTLLKEHGYAFVPNKALPFEGVNEKTTNVTPRKL